MRLRHYKITRETADSLPQGIVCLLFIGALLFYGCGAGLMKNMKTNIEDIKISSLMQKKQHDELIRNLQPMLDRGESLPSFRLFLLAAAYYEIRDYEKMFKTADLLGKKIGGGDVGGYGGNLTVYPHGILHFAAHGVFIPEHPLNSTLLLAGDRSGDGLLKAGDLYYLRLNADLITLSACETAMSTVSKGDDVIGFTRGFLYAGARSIVSSLWKVDDEATRDLMVGFYQRMLIMDRDEALRQAQLNVKKRHANPFYWAAFQLTGISEQ